LTSVAPGTLVVLPEFPFMKLVPDPAENGCHPSDPATPARPVTAESPVVHGLACDFAQLTWPL